MAGHSIPANPGALIDRKVVAWAAYDWANSAFALSVLAVLFPLVLGNFWSVADGGAAVTARLGWVTFAASAIVCVTAPVFGAIADAGGYRKRFLTVLAIVGAAMTAGLGFVDAGDWPLALGLYLIASVGFYSANVFYDSLLLDVTAPRNFNFVSTFGFSLGYLGGATLLGLHLWMLKSPATFGLDAVSDAFSYAFLSVGLWWLLFLLPLLSSVPEARGATVRGVRVIRAAFGDLLATFRHLREYRQVMLFLGAYWLYLGGAFTIIVLAANFGQRLGFSDTDIVMALFLANLAGFPATLLFGVAAHRYGARRGIYVALAVYVFACLFALRMTAIGEFFTMAILIGCVQGAVQGLSRSVYATLIPPGHPGKFFGFYGMVTKLAHVPGPAIAAVAAMLSDEPKWVILALLPLFVGGAILLTFVKIRPHAAAD